MGGRSQDALSPRLATVALLAIAVAIGAWLRFDGLGVPSYWLDEIIGQRLRVDAAAQPWWRWITGLQPDQGPLYFATQLLGDEFRGRLLPALFGIATIAVLGLALREERFGAVLAAGLLAVSPLHVYYSREARPYALILLLTAILIAALLRLASSEEAPSRERVLIVATLLALLYTHAAAAPVVAAAAVALFLLRRVRLGLLTVAVAALFPLFYRGASTAPPDVDLPGNLAFTIGRAFTVSALASDVRGRAAVAMVLFAAIGVIALWKRDRRQALVVSAMTLLPIAIALVTLRIFGHWFAIRYVAAGQLGFLLLAAVGIVAISRLAGRREWIAVPLALALCVVNARQMWPAARTESFRKLNWKEIALSIRAQAKPQDVVLAAEPWSDIALRYYLGDTMKVLPAFRLEQAKAFAGRNGVVWLATAGFSSDTTVREWLCRYPVVMSSALESFRLHFAGTQQELLRRASPSVLRAAAASLRAIDPRDDVVFGEGWAMPEDGFRWAIARRATIVVPMSNPADRVLHVEVLPFGTQTIRVRINETEVDQRELAPEWRTYAITTPAAAWVEGVNVVTFEFGHATAPGGHDVRTLAASFARIAIDAGRSPNRPMFPAIRIDAGRFLDAASVWRGTETRFPAAQLRRPQVEALLGRLGFDPNEAWPRLVRGEVHLDDVVETIAYGSDCEDDRLFLYRAFGILLERPPDPVAERDLLARMRQGASRESIVGRIAKSGDFRALALSFAPE